MIDFSIIGFSYINRIADLLVHLTPYFLYVYIHIKLYFLYIICLFIILNQTFSYNFLGDSNEKDFFNNNLFSIYFNVHEYEGKE